MNSLRTIDLNLIVVLDALLKERHVSRAAVRLNMSQPAVSHALARLRGQFDDPLLVRATGGFKLTPRAASLTRPVEIALENIRTVVDTPAFDPQTADIVFRLAMSDYGAALLLPSLLARVRDRAPDVRLIITQDSRDGMMGALLKGEIDAAIGVFPHVIEGLRSQTLWKDRFLCLADKSNARLNDGRMTLEDYLSASHMHVSVQGIASEEIERALTADRKTRRIAMILPHFSVAPSLIAGTDLVLTIAGRMLDSIDGAEKLARFEPPFVIPIFDIVQLWHERSERSEAHKWLRDSIAAPKSTSCL